MASIGSPRAAITNWFDSIFSRWFSGGVALVNV
jgi:hypothetical protein